MNKKGLETIRTNAKKSTTNVKKNKLFDRRICISRKMKIYLFEKKKYVCWLILWCKPCRLLFRLVQMDPQRFFFVLVDLNEYVNSDWICIQIFSAKCISSAKKLDRPYILDEKERERKKKQQSIHNTWNCLEAVKRRESLFLLLACISQ